MTDILTHHDHSAPNDGAPNDGTADDSTADDSTATMSGTAHWATQDTPIGPFTAVVDSGGAVLASGWTAELEELLPQVHSSLRPGELVPGDIGQVAQAIARYHDGDLAAIDAIAVRQRSGEFLNHAWDVLRTVAPGAPVTYTEYATRSGRPKAVRAAASACARNAAALFVPCHRVLRTDGSLGGFRWGLAIKQWLIEHEAACSRPA